MKLVHFTARDRHNVKGKTVVIAVNPAFIAWVSPAPGGGSAISVAGDAAPVIVTEEFDDVVSALEGRTSGQIAPAVPV